MIEKKLAIIIINYNCAKDTIECLVSLKKVNLENVSIFIVDNNSTDNSVLKLSKYINTNNLESSTYDAKMLSKVDYKTHHFSKYNFIKSDENLGFAGGNNLALKIITENKHFKEKDNIFLLNPDTTIADNTLLNFSKIDKDYFLASCVIKTFHEPNQVLSYGGYKINKFFGLIRPCNKNESPDYIYGGALFTNLNTVLKLGYLPTEYFLYWEETDYCTKAREKKIPLLLIENTYIFDKVGQSIGRGKLANYYFVRNSFIYFKKYFPLSIFTLFAVNVLRILHKIMKGDLKSAKGMSLGINDYLRSKYGYKNFS